MFVYQNRRLALERPVRGRGEQAVDFYVGLLKSGLATTPDKLGVGWCGEALGKEKAAIIFEGNWAMPFMHDTYPKTSVRRLPDGQGQDRRQPRVHRLLLDREGREEQGGRLDAARWLTGRLGMKLWVSKGLALPSRSDVKAIGGRANFLDQAKDAHGWGFPNFANTYTVDGQRPAGRRERQQVGRRHAVRRGERAEGIATLRRLPRGRPPRGTALSPRAMATATETLRVQRPAARRSAGGRVREALRGYGSCSSRWRCS